LGLSRPATSTLVRVASEGFEPPKAEPSDLQSDPFGRLGNLPVAPATCVHLTGDGLLQYRVNGVPVAKSALLARRLQRRRETDNRREPVRRVGDRLDVHFGRVERPDALPPLLPVRHVGTRAA